MLNYDQWRRDVNRTVYEYQAHMVRHIRRGYDGTDEDPNLIRWTIPAALMYCITIYTTIGVCCGRVNQIVLFLRRWGRGWWW